MPSPGAGVPSQYRTEPVDTEMERAKRWFLRGPVTGNFWETCSDCNSGRHNCPGCGEDVNHGTQVCAVCKLLIQRGQM